jgi:hypothetical protein
LPRLSEELGDVHVRIKRFDPVEWLPANQQIDEQRLDRFAGRHIGAQRIPIYTCVDVLDDLQLITEMGDHTRTLGLNDLHVLDGYCHGLHTVLSCFLGRIQDLLAIFLLLDFLFHFLT